MVEVDELELLGERSQRSAKPGVVAAGPAVDHEGDGLVAQRGPGRGEARAVDVEVQLGVADPGFQPVGPFGK